MPAGHRPFLHFWFPTLGAAASSPAGHGSLENGIPKVTWNIPHPVTIDATANADGTITIPDLYLGLCSDVNPTYSPDTVVYGRGVCQFENISPKSILNVKTAISIPHNGKWVVVGYATVRFCYAEPPGAAWFRPLAAVCRPFPGQPPVRSAFLWLADSSSRRSVVSAPAPVAPDGTVSFPANIDPVILSWPTEGVVLVAICTTEAAPDGTSRVRMLGKAQLDLSPPPAEAAGSTTVLTVKLQAPVQGRWVDVGQVDVHVTAATEADDPATAGDAAGTTLIDGWGNGPVGGANGPAPWASLPPSAPHPPRG